MTNRQPTDVKTLDQYDNPPLEWKRALDLLDAQPRSGVDFPTFVNTVDKTCRPHSAAIAAYWLDGAMYFVSGASTRKSGNIAENPACTITAHLKGMDLVLEGEASRVTDSGTLQSLASRYRELGWPVEVEGIAFMAPYTAPSGGPPPWNLYRLEPRTVYGVAGEEPGGATRWRFSNESQ